MTKDAERFSVTVTMTKVVRGDHIVYAYGLDADGWEVVWTDHPWHFDELVKMIGHQVIVQGHEIHAYGGTYGAWGPSMPPARKEISDGTS